MNQIVYFIQNPEGKIISVALNDSDAWRGLYTSYWLLDTYKAENMNIWVDKQFKLGYKVIRKLVEI